MNPFPSQNANKDSFSTASSNSLWFHSYFPVPNTTGIDLSQVPEPNPAEGVMIHQADLFPPPLTRESRNDMETVKQKSTNQSPSKALKQKPQIKKRSASNKPKKTQSIPETKREIKNPDIKIDISSFDTSGVPPVCSCTGVSRVCYKWGMGGWQSSCCTISISTYPLPMSTKRPGSRLAGRKMSNGAYVKLLVRLAGEGYNLSHPVDLKNHWARHGTNKFVTIK